MILKNFWRIVDTSKFQFITTILLLSFLLFFLNILVALTVNMYSFSNTLKKKLWVYIYFREWKNKQQTEQIYSKIIKLKTELERNKLVVIFQDKEEAIKWLAEKYPNIIRNFEKYWVGNPIPPTMYINFDNKQEYEFMKKILSKPEYKDIISDFDEIEKNQSFEEQEERISKIIEFANFIIKFYIFLSIVLVVIIIWFILLILKINFYSFYEQVEVEKLIWAFYWQIKFPFIIQAFVMIVVSFIVEIVYSFSLINYLNIYFTDVFDYDIIEIVLKYQWQIGQFLLYEFVGLVLIVIIVSNFFLNRLIKKI